MPKQKQSTTSAAKRREQQRKQRQSRLEGAQAKAALTTGTATRAKAPQQNKRKRVRRGWDQRYMLPIVIALIAVIVGVFVLISHLQSSPTAQAPTLTSSQVFNVVTHVNPSTLESVGTGGVSSPFQIMKSSGSTPLQPLIGPTGKPEFLYIGAEYCPYCAAQRWAMVVALSRFGTFSQLYQTTSSSTDIYPNTPTFSFLSTLYKQPLYTSKYIDFVAVETQGNIQNSVGSYPILQTPTSQQQQLLATYDAPPYIDAAGAGSIPFIDVYNKYVAIGLGPGFSSQDLQGMQWSDIASSLSSGSSAASKHILGSANYMTAAICLSTNQQPASVCSTSAIQKIEATVEKGTAQSSGGRGTPLAVGRPPEAVLRRGIV